MNRKGNKKPKCTYQLREQQNKDEPLLRLDLIGRTHKNPPGDFPLANIDIPCPHIHIAHPYFGDSIAYPLEDDNYAKIYLTKEELSDLVKVLKEFLRRCNVSDLESYHYIYQKNLF